METLYSAEFPEPDTGTIRGDLAASYRSFIAFANTDTGKAYMRMSITESLRDERIAALYRASTERRELEARRSLERAIERGEVRKDADIDTAVQYLGGIIIARVILGRPLPQLEDVDDLVEFTLRGISA